MASEAVEAAIKAIRYDDASQGCMAARPGNVEAIAKLAIEAAAPIIERQVAEGIAQAIEALDDHGYAMYRGAYNEAAAIARNWPAADDGTAHD